MLDFIWVMIDHPRCIHVGLSFVLKFRLRVVKGSRVRWGQRLEFWDPLYISGTVGARNFKFGTQIECKGQ